MVIPWLWLATALLAAPRAWRLGGKARVWLVLGALLLASLHGFGWNKPVYRVGREWLMELGLYGDRIYFKLAIGAAFVGLLAFGGWRAWRGLRELPRFEHVAFVMMLVDALYITTRTLSIDGWMPDAIAYDPGKTVFGSTLAGAALVALLLPQRNRQEETHAAR